jgi:hypothetical protein
MHPAFASSEPDQQHLVAISRAPTRTELSEAKQKQFKELLEQILGWVDGYLLVSVLVLLLLLATAAAA